MDISVAPPSFIRLTLMLKELYDTLIKNSALLYFSGEFSQIPIAVKVCIPPLNNASDLGSEQTNRLVTKTYARDPNDKGLRRFFVMRRVALFHATRSEKENKVLGIPMLKETV